MASKAVQSLFSRLERQKIAAVVTVLKKNGNPGLTKNDLIKHATLELVETVLLQLQEAKRKRDQELQEQANDTLAKESTDPIPDGGVPEVQSPVAEQGVDNSTGTGTES